MEPPIRPDERLLLIGWDAADWKIARPLMERGEMPNLARLVARGVTGDLATMRPVLSPMLWNTIATGQRPERHGILGFAEVDERLGEVRAVSSLSRKCKALWNMVTQAGGRAHVLNWYASHPAEPIHGIAVSNFFAQDVDRLGELPPLERGVVHPAEMTDEFAALRLGIEEVTPDILSLFVPRMDEVDQDTDSRLHDIAKLVAETISIHAAAIRQLQDGPWNLAALYYPGIDHFCHGFMDFHPPRLPQVDERAFDLYQDVVNGAYRLHDLLLGPLLDLAGPDARVLLLSDHGFHCDHLRRAGIPADPVGPAVQHREYGMLAMAGPGIQQGETIHGAGLLDIAPTALAMLGLPIGRDMPGRVLVEAFVRSPEITAVAAWDDLPGEAGLHGPDVFLPPSADAGMMRRFAELGYLHADQTDGGNAVAATHRENHWALAQSHLDAGRPDLAVPVLEPLCLAHPERGDFGLALADALRRIGLSGAANELVKAVCDAKPSDPAARYLLGISALDSGLTNEAAEHFAAALERYPDRPDLHARIGKAFTRMGDYDEADRCFRQALDLDPSHLSAWTGLTWTALRRGNWETAETSALEAVALDFSAPWPHALLGWARLGQGKPEEAIEALRMSARIAPNWRLPRRLLARAMTRAGGPDLLEAHEAVQRAGDLEKAIARKRREVVGKLARIDVASICEGYRRHAAERMRRAETFVPIETIVVSGLPRSGTSLMMQMLRAAGVPVLTDHRRAADEDNPEGYLEWERIKDLPGDPEVIREAQGMAVKVVSPLLRHLPPGHRIRVIFLHRPIDEVLASQKRMLANQGMPDAAEDARLRRAMLEHQKSIMAALLQTPNAETLIVPYPELVADPLAWAEKIAGFLKPMIETDPALMAAVVKPDLYRNRR